METYKLRQPANDRDPYLDMLGDINNQIAYFRKRNELLPNYIIVNTQDYERLITVAQEAKLIPATTRELFNIQRALIIPSDFVQTGNFDVVGS